MVLTVSTRPIERQNTQPAPGLHLVLQRMADGDEAALAELYDATCAYVHGVAVRILGDAQAAEEVTVEVYHRAWDRAADYDRRRGSVASWLMTMVRSRSIDRLRARAAAKERTTSLEEQGPDPMDPRPGPDRQVQLACRNDMVRHAIRALSAEQQQVIELAFFEGLSHGAISKRLDQPLGTTKTRIRTGIRRLAEQLQTLETAR